MSKKIYIIKDGNAKKSLTTAMCLGTNDKSKYPVRVVDGVEELVDMVAHFGELYEGKAAYITEDPIEIRLFTEYLMKNQNPYFYDLDNPTNSREFYLPQDLK